MKQLSIINKRACCIALTAFAFGIAGTAHAQSGTSGQGKTQGTAATSTNHGFSNNKKDQSNAGSGDHNAGNRGDSSMSSGSDEGKDKSLGNNKPRNSGMESGGGAESSASSGSGGGTNAGMK